MKYVIRAIDPETGHRIGIEKISEKKKAVRRKILAAGMQYLEYPASLGSENALGQEIQEEVTIIEGIARENYV